MIVVTGGAGFIGSNLVAALSEREDLARDIVVCDTLGSGEKWRNIAKRELADIIPPEDLFSFLESHKGMVETVFHLGASSSTTERDADFIVKQNFRTSVDLWKWCADNDARLIYASSAATYGDGSEGFEDDASIEGLAGLQPLNPYGWSKHLFDRRIARLVAEGRKTPKQWAGLKFFNVYGPNESHKGSQQSVVAQIYPRAAANLPATLFRSHNPDYEDGGQLRDFVWVGDCVDVMIWLHDTPDVSGLFNLGTGQARSFGDLARAVYVALEKDPRIDFVDTPVEIRDRYQYFTEARMEKLRNAGYPGQFTPLEEGVRRYVQDYLDTEDPYR
ncbi:ADP-glyceromanno-heptose 6-epimerase [Nisaea nitritireducens]|uniref:ADP-glyceromanno-heptose 6-epimerase n=1 Tax=Nisaea nitritireducens TaxID=568392 RepID=UPI00186635F6|nr:ADP-glyceromanno-heptose 6-epimerase [Nisaea nitritireducens]